MKKSFGEKLKSLFSKGSTINDDFYDELTDMLVEGDIGAKTAFEVLNGEDVPRIVYSELEPKFRQSCGCISRECLENVFKDVNGEVKIFNKHLGD